MRNTIGLSMFIVMIIFSTLLVPASATYYAYNSTTQTWTNTSFSNSMTYSTGEVLLNTKLTDYYSFWGFDEVSGTVADYNSTTGLPLTIVGGTRNTTSQIYGSSLSLNGANGQYASPGTGNDWTSGDYTISMWVKSVGLLGVDVAFAGRWYSNGYMLYHDENGIIRLFTNTNNCGTPTGTYPSDSAWHYLTGVKSGTSGYIYLDGGLKTCTGALLTSWNSAGAGYRFEIGTYKNDAAPNFNGLIDEVKIWNRALNTTEALNLYNSTYTPTGNVTSFYLAPVTNITNRITINWTTPTGTNYTAWYKNSSGGTFTQLSGGTLTGNHTWDVAAFQNTTVEVRMTGNGSVSPRGVQIAFDLGPAGNTAPVLTSIGNQDITTRSYLNLSLNATDIDGDTLTFATNASKGTLNNATGAYSWHVLAGETGTYYFNFSVSDPYNGTDWETIRVNVSNSLPFTLPQVYTNWWNTSWTYRTTTIVPNGQRPYQLSLNISNSTGTNNVTTIFCNGHCKPNFTDIRFTLDNGTLLPFWIENSTTGKIWVNLTANGTVNMYYGNTTTTSTSDGNTTFIIFDDFLGAALNTTKWTLGGYGAYSVSGGELYLNGTREIKSKSMYSSGYFMRAKARRATDYKEWLVGFMTIGDGAESKMSVPIDHNVDNPANANITCVNGKDNLVYKINAYPVPRDAASHIGMFQRGGTQDTCILDDLYSINASYPSTISRYLIADTYNGASFYLDYILLGYYSLTGSVWGTWGPEETGTAGTEYIPPIPVLAEEINASDHSWRYFAWSEGWGYTTDAYIVGINDIYTVNTHIQNVNETLSPHEYMNVSVYALNYSNSTVNMTPLDSYYQRPNNIPILSPVGTKKIYQNNTLSIQLNATDTDDDVLIYGTNATKGTLNNITGVYVFSAIPADVGTYYWRFNATDAYSGTDYEDIVVTVLAPRTIPVQLYNVGWQNVLINSTMNMSQVADMYGATYVAIWNSSSQEWDKYKDDWSHRQNQSVSRDQAVMVLVASNSTKNVIVSNTFNWTLNIGQNLVGIPENLTLSAINSSVNVGVGCDNVDEITYTYPNNMTDVTYICQNGAGQTNASVLVQQGYGVWMNALQVVDMKDVVG